MNIRFLLLSLMLCLGTGPLMAQLSEPRPWHFKAKLFRGPEVSFEGYRAVKAKVKGPRGTSTVKRGWEVSTSHQTISLLWNTPSGESLRVHARYEQRYEGPSDDAPIHITTTQVDTSAIYQRLTVQVTRGESTVARLHLRLLSTTNVLEPPPMEGQAELWNGQKYELRRSLGPAVSLGEFLNRPSVWSFVRDGEEVAAYHYHYNSPQLALSPSLTTEETDALTAVIAALSVWIRYTYMSGAM